MSRSLIIIKILLQVQIIQSGGALEEMVLQALQVIQVILDILGILVQHI